MSLVVIDKARMPSGRVNYVVRRNGRVEEIVYGDNIVVDLGRMIMAAAIGGDAADGVITGFAVGTSLQAPASGNTMLTGQYAKPVDGVSYPSPGEVAFAFSLASGEANGMALGEIGLLTASGKLFARRVRQAALPKDATVSLSGTWFITW